MAIKLLKITHTDGAQNEIVLHCPKEPKINKLILILPAMGVRASYYKPLAQTLVQSGYTVALIDWRGQGKSSVSASWSHNYGYQHYIDDLNHTIEKLNEIHSDTSIYIVGHSLGGQIASLFASKFTNKLSGIVLIASCLVHYTGWEGQQPWKIKLAGNLFSPLSQLLGHFPGKIIGFGGREARSVMKDWCHNALTGRYELQNSDFNYENALAQLSIPTLAISLEGDTFAPKKAVENLYNKFGNQSVIHHRHITKQETDYQALNHFNWVKESDFFVELIGEWIRN